MRKLSTEELETLQNKVDDVKVITTFGESPFQALSYLKSYICELMDKIVKERRG